MFSTKFLFPNNLKSYIYFVLYQNYLTSIMASNLLRKEVLDTFKKLHRTSRKIFTDKEVLAKVRKEINDRYKQNKHISDPDSIKDLIQLANEAHYELKTSIVELENTGPGKYRLNIRPEMFDEPDPSLLKKSS